MLTLSIIVYNFTDKSIIEELIKSGADIYHKNNKGTTPLMLVPHWDEHNTSDDSIPKEDIAKLLIKKEKEKKIEEEKKIKKQELIEKEKEIKEEELIKEEKKFLHSQTDGATALYYAVKENDKGLVTYLPRHFQNN